MIGWLKRLLGLEQQGRDRPTTPDDAVDSQDFPDHSLYDIGDMMCRHYSHGILSTPQATHYGEHSMRVVLEDAYGGVSLSPSMVEDLDRLMDNAADTSFIARHEGGIDPDKVELFRRKFFRLFGEQSMQRVLSKMYENARDGFALESLVDAQTIDGYRFTYQIRDDTPEAQVAMESEPMTMQEATFSEESVEMMNVDCQFSLVESHIGDHIDEMIATEAELLWDKIAAMDGVELTDDTDEGTVERVFDSIQMIENAYGRADTIVTNDEFDFDKRVHGCDVISDGTGVMDTDFIVADSGSLGYRVTSSPVSVGRTYHLDRFIYRMNWAGNYVITGKDMVAST